MRNHTKQGFTLIELLIVVVIIGILASIAIPQYSSFRKRAYYTALKSDLKNVATQQEIYYSDTYEYAAVDTDLGFTPTEEVSLTISEGTSSGWNATATHTGLDANEGCAVYYGTAAAPSIGSVTPASAGAIACTDN